MWAERFMYVNYAYMRIDGKAGGWEWDEGI